MACRMQSDAASLLLCLPSFVNGLCSNRLVTFGLYRVDGQTSVVDSIFADVVNSVGK